MRRTVYFERFKKHVNDIQRHLQEKDYVQAAEKVWGALSSFVNAFLSQEATSPEEKKQGFALLFRKLTVHDASLDAILRKNFMGIDDFTTKAQGLHLYFYGKRDFPETYLKSVIYGFAETFKDIYNKVVPSN